MPTHSLAHLILKRAKDSPDRDAIRYKDDAGAYVGLRWKHAFQRVERIAAGLMTLVDLDAEPVIAILGPTSTSWILCDCAVLSLGLRSVPIYPSLLPPEVGYLHADSEASVVIVEDRHQLSKVRAFRDGFEFSGRRYERSDLRLQHIVVMNPAGIEPASDWEGLEALEARGESNLEDMRRARGKRLAKVRRDNVATYTYTSGTTGPPKGVIQTHGNMLSLLENVAGYGIFDDPRVQEAGLFLFLPLAHSFGRLVEFGGIFYGCPIVVAEIPSLADDLRAARPGFLPAAPRVYEKVKAKVESALETAPALRRSVFAWAMGVGQRTLPYRSEGTPLPWGLALRHRIADRLVLSKLRARLGLDRCATLLTGSAPISEEVHEFFLAMGLDLIEAYGLTETCPGLTMNRPRHFRLGSVGPAVQGIELKIAEDGEILARGPNVATGYLNRPDATAESFVDGWFRTGDLGRLDKDGFLYITGRKKDLIKTSGGKYVAPAKVEILLKNDPLIAEAIVVGEARQYCVALLAIEPDRLQDWAKRFGHSTDPTSEHVRSHLQRAVDSVNEKLASFETVKDFAVMPQPPSVENGLLTASLKVRRKPVETFYADLVQSMYSYKSP